MTYDEALNFILKKQSLGIMPGLSRINKLLEDMGNPQDDINIIHIAGTNGKGTVAKTINNALINSNKKIGLFSSPWIIDYREQIQINNEFIHKEDFASYVEKYQNNDCSEFEFLTAIMFKYFADNRVDYAVIECGMGGREDATNVEKENLSVITSISLDHTDFLGSTLEEIAENKSGILRKNCDCVLYSDEYANIFKDKCKELVIAPESDNLSVVNAVLDNLGLKPVNALVKLPARQERKNGILLDGGHNVAAAKMLEPGINNETAVIGMMRDKDIEGYLSIIAPKCKKIICVDVDNPRAISAKELAGIAKKYCSDVITAESAKSALLYEPSLICGSFYMIREIYNLF
jgi:dihydrofolate synthase/folylpolyglutamate synthase